MFDSSHVTTSSTTSFFFNGLIAETYALNEAFAVQGSVIPWFYGIHQVICSVSTRKLHNNLFFFNSSRYLMELFYPFFSWSTLKDGTSTPVLHEG